MTAKLTKWQTAMKRFHQETQEGLGGFAVAVVRAKDLPSIARSKERDAIAITKTVVKWKAMIATGTWQLCLACDYEFRAPRFARAFVFMQAICEEPTMAMIVGVCEECSKKDDAELLEIAYQGCREMGLAKSKMDVGRA